MLYTSKMTKKINNLPPSVFSQFFSTKDTLLNDHRIFGQHKKAIRLLQNAG